jgi:hypothetical protein
MRRVFKIFQLGRAYLKRFGLKASIEKFQTIRTSGGFKYLSNHPESAKLKAGYGRKPYILFVSSNILLPSHVYRIENIRQALKESGVSSKVLEASKLNRSQYLGDNLIGISFWRTEENQKIAELREYSKSRDFKSGYDTDDITFDRNIFNSKFVPALGKMPPREKKYQEETLLELQRKQILQADFVTFATRPIGNLIGVKDKPNLLIPNVIPRWMESQGKITHRLRSQNMKENYSIVYPSGSRTHDVDFYSSRDQIFQFLAQNPESTLTFLGAAPLSPHEIPSKVREQVQFKKTVSHQKLIEELSQFDVQIVPLEVGNPFVEGKSALKFLQGSAAGIVTIASATEPMKEAIRNEESGYLASKSLSWVQALTNLKDPGLRRKISEAAYVNVMEECTVSNLKPHAARLMEIFLQS